MPSIYCWPVYSSITKPRTTITIPATWRSLHFRRGPFRRFHFHLSCGHVVTLNTYAVASSTNVCLPPTNSLPLFVTASFLGGGHGHSGSSSPVSQPFRELISLRTVNNISPLLYTFKGSVTTRALYPCPLWIKETVPRNSIRTWLEQTHHSAERRQRVVLTIRSFPIPKPPGLCVPVPSHTCARVIIWPAIWFQFF